MKTNYFKLMTLLMFIAVLAVACTKDNEGEAPPGNNNPTVPAEVNKYTACGSYGDVIRYEIDETNKYIVCI